MPNSYFQFKQFRIDQGQTAMKVTTEACLFGALSEKLTQPKSLNRILDIGTGTGLLALMKAQQTDCPIDGIELDDLAFLQAKENFSNSPWSEQLRAIPENINSYSPDFQYDLIISNPPFFKDHFQSADLKRNLALHSNSLSYEQLADVISKLLSASGVAHILLPPQPMSILIGLMEKMGLYAIEKIEVFNHPDKPIFREIVSFSRKKVPLKRSTILIKDELNEYAEAFVQLLRPYYLHL